MRRAALIAVVLALVVPGSAQAVVLVNPDGTRLGGHWQKWADRARVPTPPGSVVVRKGGCPNRGGACAGVDGIWVADNDRGSFLHELGHIFDYRVMTEAARRRFLLIVGSPLAWRDPTSSWFDLPVERFATGWANCALGRPNATTGIILKGRTHRRVCSLIRRVALRAANDNG